METHRYLLHRFLPFKNCRFILMQISMCKFWNWSPDLGCSFQGVNAWLAAHDHKFAD
jgi:hypothetical protein